MPDRFNDDEIIVGLDVGTTKVCAVVARKIKRGSSTANSDASARACSRELYAFGDLSAHSVLKEYDLEILGVGEAVSRGLRKGVVINIDATTSSIMEALEDAERKCERSLENVYVGVSGAHIRSFNSHGIVAVDGNEVVQRDIDRVIDAAKAVSVPMDREIIHVLPQEFIVDGEDGIRDPLGMAGVRLEAKVHIVTGAHASAQNIVTCTDRCTLEVDDIVLEQLASSLAVLTEDEKKLGVVLVDIGGGTTDVAIFCDGAIQHSAVIPIGGQHMTNDIAVGLRTPQSEAEEIKRRSGSAHECHIKHGETIEVPSLGTRKTRILSRLILPEILGPRVEEIFELVAREVEKVGLSELLASGVVVTGGSSLLPGLLEVAEETMSVPARLGIPDLGRGRAEAIRNPMYATGVGLVKYGFLDSVTATNVEVKANVYDKVKKRMGAWLQEVF